MDDTLLRQLGEYCNSLHYGSLSREVVHQAKRHILDSIACAFGAFPVSDSAVAVARAVAKDAGCSAETTIMVSGDQTSMNMAALVNGTMVRYLDFNDVFKGRAWIIHPSDNIATAFAVGEGQRVSGKELLTAIVLGYEIQQRLANLPVKESVWYRGWDPNTTLSYSTAAIAAKLLGLDADGIANAIALAASRCSLVQIRRGQIAMDKALSIGQISAASILAALLARYGGTAVQRCLKAATGLKSGIGRLRPQVSYRRL